MKLVVRLLPLGPLTEYALGELDCDGAVQPRIARFPYFTHAPFPQRRQKFIGPQSLSSGARHAVAKSITIPAPQPRSNSIKGMSVLITSSSSSRPAPCRSAHLPRAPVRTPAAPSPRNPERPPAAPAIPSRLSRIPVSIASSETRAANSRDALRSSPATLRCPPSPSVDRAGSARFSHRHTPPGSRTSDSSAATTPRSPPAQTQTARACAP